MSEISKAWAHRDFANASDAIKVILSDGTDEMKAQTLLLSGMMKDDQGHSSDARNEWQSALHYAEAGTFVLCSLQNEIGKSYAGDGMIDDALLWYERAINTCANGQEFSCQPTLSEFLEIRNGHIPPELEDTVAAAVQKSWRVLELDGVPPLDNLPNAIVQLRKGFSAIVTEIERDEG